MNNTLQDTGLNKLRDDLNSDIDKGIVGIGNTAETKEDVTLVNPLIDSVLSLTGTTYNRQLEEKYTLPTTLDNGSTITEFGTYSSGSGDYYTRVTFDGIFKDSDTDLVIETIYFIERG